MVKVLIKRPGEKPFIADTVWYEMKDGAPTGNILIRDGDSVVPVPIGQFKLIYGDKK